MASEFKNALHFPAPKWRCNQLFTLVLHLLYCDTILTLVFNSINLNLALNH